MPKIQNDDGDDPLGFAPQTAPLGLRPRIPSWTRVKTIKTQNRNRFIQVCCIQIYRVIQQTSFPIQIKTFINDEINDI